jgi:hypothetical protein
LNSSSLEESLGVTKLEPFESKRIQDIGLSGKVLVTAVIDVGPAKPPLSELIIVLHNPVEGVLKLSEPVGQVTYVQQHSGWKTTSVGTLDWRKVELYSTGNATLISIWNGLGNRFTVQAVNWNM